MNDAPCVLCTLDNAPSALTPTLMSRWVREGFASAAHAFAAECGGAPDQLDHYAWHHLSSVPGFWADNGPWER